MLARVFCTLTLVISIALACGAQAQMVNPQFQNPIDTFCEGGSAKGQTCRETNLCTLVCKQKAEGMNRCGGDQKCRERVHFLALHGAYCALYPDSWVNKHFAGPAGIASGIKMDPRDKAKLTHQLQSIASYERQPRIFAEARQCLLQVADALSEINP